VYDDIDIYLISQRFFCNDIFQYITNCVQKESAPYRAITVKDALYDLPEVKCGSNIEEMSYVGEPITHFQRKVIIRGMHLIVYTHNN